jgi:outer membrane cobalamin receptor
MTWKSGSGVWSFLVVAGLLPLVGGCVTGVAPSNPPGYAPGRMITASEIERTGAWNAWDALRRVHLPFAFLEDASGRPFHLSRRGQPVAGRSRGPLVVVDGARTEGLGMLHVIQAGDIATIRVIEGTRAVALFGPMARAGAILIETKNGRDLDRAGQP